MLILSAIILSACQGVLYNGQDELPTKDIRVTLNYPEIYLEKNNYLEDHIIFERVEVALYEKPGNQLTDIEKQKLNSQINNELIFRDILLTDKKLVIKAKIIGKKIINGNSGNKVLYLNKEQDIENKNKNIEIDISFEPLPASSIKINFHEYYNRINEITLINKKENITNSYYLSENHKDHIVIKDNDEFNLKAGYWQIVLEGNFNNRIVKDFLLLPEANKELNLNLMHQENDKVILEDNYFVLSEKSNNIRISNNDILEWDKTPNADKYTIYKSKSEEKTLSFPIKLVKGNNISLEKLETGFYYWIRGRSKDGKLGEKSNPYFIERNYSEYNNDYFRFKIPENWHIVSDKRIEDAQTNAIEVIIADDIPEKEITRDIQNWEEPTQFIYKLFSLSTEDEMDTKDKFFDYVYDELNWFKNIARIEVIESEKIYIDSQPGFRINIRYTDGYKMGNVIAENVFVYKNNKAHLIYYGALEDKFCPDIKKALLDSLKYK